LSNFFKKTLYIRRIG